MVAPLMKLNKKEFNKWKKSVLSSDFYKDVIKKRNVTETTKNRYVLSLTTYCMYNGKSIDDLMDEADKEERANIRVKDRQILKRLNNFRDWMVEQGLQKLTCQTRFNDAKWSYKKRYIDIPELDDDYAYPREDKLKYGDLPTTIDIQKAVDDTSALSNKALFLFIASSGTAKMETSLLTVQHFIDATKEYHNEIDNIHNVLQILDGRKDVVPLFEMHREKTDYYYHTCCSPEATQAIINLLQSQPFIKNNDPLFYLSYNGIGKAFQRANHKHNWGKIKNYHYFSSHRLRKRHASIVRDYDLANYLQGRKPSSKIKETYFFENPAEVKKEYLKIINKLTIYDSNYKDIYSEEYEELLNQNEELTKLVNAQKSQIDELQTQKDLLLNMINDVETKVDNIANANDLTKIQEYISGHELVEKYDLTSTIIGYYKEDVKKDDFSGVTDSYIEDLITVAFNTTSAFQSTAIRDENYKTDKKWKQINSEIRHYEHDYIENMGYKLSKSQTNKISEELGSYSITLWENKKKVESSKVQSIIDSIVIRH